MDLRNKKRWLFVLGLLALTVGLGAAWVKHSRWKKFATVVPGKLYRSGELRADQLDDAITQLGLRCVVCFEAGLAEQDQAVCQRRGVTFYSLPMPSDGVGNPAYFKQFLEMADDPAHQPLLFHCRAGVARTGAACALYRVTREGWTVDAAIEEIRSYDRKGRCDPPLQAHVRGLSAQFSAQAAKPTSAPR